MQRDTKEEDVQATEVKTFSQLTSKLFSWVIPTCSKPRNTSEASEPPKPVIALDKQKKLVQEEDAGIEMMQKVRETQVKIEQALQTYIVEVNARVRREEQKGIAKINTLVKLGIASAFIEEKMVTETVAQSDEVHEERLMELLGTCPSRPADYASLSVENKLVSMQALNQSLTEYQATLEKSYEAYFENKYEKKTAPK